MHIGKKIRMVRQLRGLTQEGLARKINKTRALLSHIEQTGKINYYTLQSVSKALGLTAGELENFRAEIANTQDVKDDHYGRKGMETLRRRMQLLEKENKILKQLVQSQKELIAELKKKKAK